jgi:hypothetical protein
LIVAFICRRSVVSGLFPELRFCALAVARSLFL